MNSVLQTLFNTIPLRRIFTKNEFVKFVNRYFFKDPAVLSDSFFIGRNISALLVFRYLKKTLKIFLGLTRWEQWV